MAVTQEDIQQAKDLTAASFSDSGLSVPDLDYITLELLSEYATAQEKDLSKCEIRDTSAMLDKNDSDIDEQDYPCYIGHSPVSIGNGEWTYQNNNTSDGCDNESHLCGSGNSWRAKLSRIMLDRYCANGKKGFLGWP